MGMSCWEAALNKTEEPDQVSARDLFLLHDGECNYKPANLGSELAMPRWGFCTLARASLASAVGVGEVSCV